MTVHGLDGFVLLREKEPAIAVRAMNGESVSIPVVASEWNRM